MDFLPTYHSVPTANGWLPSYKLFVGQRERIIPGIGPFSSPAAAVKAAMDYVQIKLNPPILSHAVEPDADELLRQEWREQKAREAHQERSRVFGTEGPQTVFSCQGRPVTVERRVSRKVMV